jgi:hypothetical protein
MLVATHGCEETNQRRDLDSFKCGVWSWWFVESEWKVDAKRSPAVLLEGHRREGRVAVAGLISDRRHSPKN